MIGKHLLIHSCTVRERIATDRNGTVQYADEVTLEHVRFVPVFQAQRNQVGEQQVDKLTLFIDGARSTPHGYVPKELDSVIWQDKCYTIRTVTSCSTHGSNSIHHFEVALV